MNNLFFLILFFCLTLKAQDPSHNPVNHDVYPTKIVEAGCIGNTSLEKTYTLTISNNSPSRTIWIKILNNNEPNVSIKNSAGFIILPRTKQEVFVTVRRITNDNIDRTYILSFIDMYSSVSVSSEIFVKGYNFCLPDNPNVPVSRSEVSVPINGFAELNLISANVQPNIVNFIDLQFWDSYGNPMNLTIDNISANNHRLSILPNTTKTIRLQQVFLRDPNGGSASLRNITGNTMMTLTNGNINAFRSVTTEDIKQLVGKFSNTDTVILLNHSELTSVITIEFYSASGILFIQDTVILGKRSRMFFNIKDKYHFDDSLSGGTLKVTSSALNGLAMYITNQNNITQPVFATK